MDKKVLLWGLGALFLLIAAVLFGPEAAQALFETLGGAGVE